MTTTLTVRRPPQGVPVATVEFPEDMEGHGIAHYVITHAPPLRKGMPHRYLGYLVLTADGNCLNDNLPVFCRDTRQGAIDRANVGMNA
jgi:hypothetical protein